MNSILNALLAAGLIGAWAQERGNAPRELTSEKDHWINSDRSLKLAEQVGKVVYLEFGFLK